MLFFFFITEANLNLNANGYPKIQVAREYIQKDSKNYFAILFQSLNSGRM